jgi:threonine/homoserine/homoserine lactone efflux protein
MTFDAIILFTGAFFLLALSPGPGLAAILSRSISRGLKGGYAVTAGLVLGDAVFLAIAMIGLSAIATTFGPFFQIVKYAGAAYLIWLGIQAWRSAATPIDIQSTQSGPIGAGTIWADVGLGLVVTLGNPKPILFYGALLPTFLDLVTISVHDFITLMTVVSLVSAVVYGGYMLLIERARRLLSTTHAIRRLNQTTGAMLIGSGIVVASR